MYKRTEYISITSFESNPTISYAKEELSKYLIKMSNMSIHMNKASKNTTYEIILGTFKYLKINSDIKVKDSKFDDAIYINITNGKGIISGINPRSTLLAVYRFLAEAGCKWIRPGKDGEIIPKVNIQTLSIHILEKPSYRHMGICIEGANSNKNVLDIIEWMPKAGFNSYFIQFREAYTFYERWYNQKRILLKNQKCLQLKKQGNMYQMH